MTATAFDNRKVVSLETLAQAKLESALKQIDIALSYIERLVDSVDDTGEQFNEARHLLWDTTEARGTIEAIEGALHGAVKHGNGEITYYG